MRRLLLAFLSVAVSVALITGVAPSAQAEGASDVPAAIDVHSVDPNATLLYDATVVAGVQTYRCQAASSVDAWVLVGPQALLAGHHAAVYHSFGTRWEYLRDRSAVTASVLTQVPSSTPNSVAQLLLAATPDHAGPTGLFTKVAYVQRLDTIGGTPHGTCDAQHIGAITVSPYRAHYYFWAA